MKRQWSDMTYDRELECWFVHIDGRACMMHCGEWFDLWVGEKQSLPCRLELARQWYVIIGTGQVRLNLRTKDTYKVEV